MKERLQRVVAWFFPRKEPVLTVCIITTGQRDGWVLKKSVGFGINKGDLEDGQQRYFDTMETLLLFHPEVKKLVERAA